METERERKRKRGMKERGENERDVWKLRKIERYIERETKRERERKKERYQQRSEDGENLCPEVKTIGVSQFLGLNVMKPSPFRNCIIL